MSRFFADWPYKLLAVAVSVTIWGLVATRDRAFVSIDVPIDYVGLERDLALLGIPQETAEVDVAVARWALARFRPDGLRVRVDLSRAGDGERLVALSPSDVLAPPGVRVRRLAPSRLRLRLARVTETTLRVVPIVRGTPAPGHRVAAVRVEPIAVQVKGPRSTIETRDIVQTTPVDVAGRRSGVTRSVGLALPDLVSPVNDGRVQVTVDIQADNVVKRETEAASK